MASKNNNGKTPNRIDGTNENDLIDGSDLAEEIDARPGDDIVRGSDGDDRIKGGAGDDTLDGGAGNDEVDGTSGNDHLIFNVAENEGSTNRYDGGAHIDSLTLAFTREEWMRDEVQQDIAAFLSFIEAHVDPESGMATAQRFHFSSLGLEVRRIEELRVTVDGVELDPRDEIVVAHDDALTIETEHSVVSGNVAANDSIPDLLRITELLSGPSPGLLQFGTDGSFSYDPGNAFDSLAQGESATVHFTYRATDADYDTDTATAVIRITGSNDAPVAAPDVAAVDENSPVRVDVLANDTDVDTSDTHTLDSVAVIEGLGIASIVDNELLWSPGSDYDYLAVDETASARVAYIQSDNHGATASSVLTISITGVNDAPVVAPIDALTNEEGSFEVNLLGTASDVDASDVLTAVSFVQSGGRTIDFLQSGAALSFNPAQFNDLAEGESATVTFDFDVSDSHVAVGNSLTVTVEGRNDAPIAVDNEARTFENDAVRVDVLANDTDVDVSDTHTLISGEVVSGGGLITVGNSEIEWIPGSDYDYLAAGEAASVTVRYTQSDNHGATDEADLKIVVEGVNDAPVAQAISAAATEDDGPVVVDLLATASDVDLTDVLEVRDLQQVSGRSVPISVTDAVLAVDPGGFNDLAQGQQELVVFSFNVFDGHVDVSNTVTLTVEGQNDVPTVSAVLSSSASEQDAVYSIDLLAGAADVDDGAVLAVASLVENSGQGGWTLSGNTLAIDPDHFDALNNGDVATLTFDFEIVDEHGAAVPQQLTVDIEGFTDAPTITAKTGVGAWVNQVELTVTVAPADRERVDLSFINLPAGAVVLDAVLGDVSAGISGALGDYSLTLVLDGARSVDSDLEIVVTGIAGDGTLVGESSSIVDIAFDANTHVANISFSNDDQGIWASGDAPIIEFHEYLPIMGGIARVWDKATESWIDTNTGMWNSGEFTLFDVEVTSAELIDAAMEVPRATLAAAFEVFRVAQDAFQWATNVFHGAVNTAKAVLDSALKTAKDVFDATVNGAQHAGEAVAWEAYNIAVSAAQTAREVAHDLDVLGWFWQAIEDTYHWAVGLAQDTLNLALDALTWSVDRVREGAEAIYNSAKAAAEWVYDTTVKAAEAVYEVAESAFSAAQNTYNQAVAAFDAAEAELNSAIDGSAEVEVKADVFAEVGAQIDFRLDSGSVDAQVDYLLTAHEQYNRTTDVLTITPYVANQTSGDDVAFATVSPNAQFRIVLVYEVGANLNMYVDGHATFLGTTVFDLSPNSDGLNVSTTLSSGGFQQQLDVVRQDGSPLEIEEFQGLNSGELTLIDFDSTELSPVTVPFLTKLTKDILTVKLAFPTVQTEGTAEPYDAAMFDEGPLLSVDFDELVGTFMNHINARVDIGEEIKQELGLPGLDENSGLDEVIEQVTEIFLSQIIDALDGKVSGTPIFVIDATDETSSEFLLANFWPNSVITDTLENDTATFGFYAGYGESHDVVNVSIDVDQVVAFIVNKVVEWVINAVTQGRTVYVLEKLPDINPLDLRFGIDEVLEAFDMEAAADDIKKFFDLKAQFQAADFDVNAGIHFSQEFTLSVDDMNYRVTLEDGSIHEFAVNSQPALVIDNASLYDIDGDGVVSYQMEIVPDAMFSNDTEIGLTLGYVLDFLKSTFKVDFKIPLKDLSGVSIPGLNSVKVPLVDLNFGPLLRVQGDFDLASADVFESRFEFDLGSAITQSAVNVLDDILNGTDDDDILFSREGNDVLTGGLGSDIFVFGSGSGHDVITDFMAGSGSDDVLDLTALEAIQTFDDFQALAQNDGYGNTIIDLGEDGIIKLVGVNAESLHQDDVLLA